MTDVTNLFKATVKTLKSRKKTLNGKNDAVTTEILPVSKQRCDFEMKAKELLSSITKLRDFLLEHRKDYVNAGSHLVAETSKMSDAERDKIDAVAQSVIKKCQETIVLFRLDAETQKVHPQVKEHRAHALKLIEDYLKVVCKIYSEQKAVRVKRVVDRKRISKLELDKKTKQRHLMMNRNTTDTSKDDDKKKQENRSSRNLAAIDQDQIFEDEEEISTEEAQMFERENQALFDEMNSLAAEVSQIEGKVVEIAKLQEIFAEKVLEQEMDIDRIADAVVGSTENVKDANEEIREAIKNSAGFRVTILFFLVMCALSLLFLDWYNS